MLKPKEGRLLIADPSLNESVFFKSVIILTHHTKNESIGLILNKPTKIKLHHVIDGIPESKFKLYLGGPVEKNSLHFIHTLGNNIPGAKQLTNNIYWGGDINTIIDLVKNKKLSNNNIRFFIGYSGWDEKQLNTEIREESWIVNETKEIYWNKYKSKDIWKELIKKQKSKYAIWANLPKEPYLN